MCQPRLTIDGSVGAGGIKFTLISWDESRLCCGSSIRMWIESAALDLITPLMYALGGQPRGETSTVKRVKIERGKRMMKVH